MLGKRSPSNPPRHPWAEELVLVEASDRDGLIRRVAQVAAALERAPVPRLSDVAFTLNGEIRGQARRLAVVASSVADLAGKLSHAKEKLARADCRRIQDRKGIFYFEEPLAPQGRMAFLFPGEGSQYSNMLSDLCLSFPEARASFDRIDRAFQRHSRGYLPSQMIFPATGGTDESRMWQGDGAVEAVFTANAALYSVLSALEIRPDLVMGHSTGDYSALVASGSLAIEDEAQLIGMMQRLNKIYEELAAGNEIPEARLIAVGASDRAQILEVLANNNGHAVHLAMDNCPHQLVLCSREQSLEHVVKRLQQLGALCEPLPFARGYHTPLFQPVCDKLEHFFDDLPLVLPTLELWSCATAAPVPQDIEAIRKIALDQWALPVRFRETIETAYAAGVRLFVECGPRGNLTAFVDDILRGKTHLAVPADVMNKPGIRQLTHLLGMLAAHHVPMRLDALYSRRNVDKVSLGPTAPEVKPDRRIKLATGWPLIELSEKTAARLRAKHAQPQNPAPTRAPGPGVEFTPPVPAAAVPAPAHVAPPAADAPEPQRQASAPAAAPEHREQIVDAHFRTMEHFLSVQEEVMRAYLGGKPQAQSIQVRPSADLPAAPAPRQIAAAQAARPAAAQVVRPASQPAPVPVAAVAPAAPAEPAAVPAAPAAVAASPVGPAVDAQQVAQTLLRLVAERTGYPPEMLNEGVDLEADLGIDSIKRVEILGAFQQETGLFDGDDMEALSSRKTLGEILEFVVRRGGASAPAQPASAPAEPASASAEPAVSESVAAPASPAPVAANPAGPASTAVDAQQVAQTLLRLVAERTGYPPEMLNEGVDLEADLGIDSIKRVEILGAFQQETGLFDGDDMEALSSRKTLGEILEFVVRRGGASAPAGPAGPAGPTQPALSEPGESNPNPMPFVAAVEELVPFERLVALREIDPARDVFLSDHALGHTVSVTDPGLRGLPVVPLTMAMEILAEAASVLVPDLRCVGMRDIRAHRWISLEQGKRTLKILATRQGQAGEVAVKILDAAAEADGPLVEGSVVFAADYPAPPPDSLTLGQEQPSSWTPERIYREGMFHGPAFRGIESVDACAADGARATVRVLPAALFDSTDAPALVTDPVLLDQPGQLVGLWTAERLSSGFVIFPYHLEALDLFAPNPPAGQRLDCTARIALVGDKQVRSDLDLRDDSGKLLVRFTGWEDLRFDVPRQFLQFMLTPAEVILSDPWAAALDSVPDRAACRCRRIDVSEMPRDFLDAHGGLWSRVLAFLVLGPAERRVWAELQGTAKRRREWLLGRVAAKDAIRDYLAERHGIRVLPTDIEIAKDEHGRPYPRGAWTEQLGYPLSLSISHSNGNAVALVADGRTRSVGIDLEHMGNRREGLTERLALAFTESETRLLSSLSEADEWCLRFWCAKEAVAKALGRGLTAGPRDVVVREMDAGDGLLRVGLQGRLAEQFPTHGERLLTVHTARDSSRIVATSVDQRS